MLLGSDWPGAGREIPFCSQYSLRRTSSMLTMLRCSLSAASLRAFLNVGETRKFRVSLFVSSKRIGGCPAVVCASALL